MFCVSEKNNRVNSLTNEKNNDTSPKEIDSIKGPPPIPPKQPIENNTEENAPPSWRKPNGRQIKNETALKSHVSFSKFAILICDVFF